MINEVKAIVKTLGIETSKNTQTKVKGCKNMPTKGINIKKDKFTEDILVYTNKLDNKTINTISETLTNNGYMVKVVPGIIIVEG